MKLFLALCFLALAHADSLAHFEAAARVSGVAPITAATSEDLPEPGYANRYHFLFPQLMLPHWDDWAAVTVLSDGAGDMWILIPGWGWLELTPTDPAVFVHMAALTAFETRWQHVTVTAHEILIEEPE